MAQKAATQKLPTLPADRALKALTQQLAGLQKLKNRNYQEADAEETEWEHLTEKHHRGRVWQAQLQPE